MKFSALVFSSFLAVTTVALGQSNYQISVDGQKISGTTANTGDYASFQSVKLDGVLNISAPGEVTLTVEPVAENWSPVNLKSITLTPL